MKTIITILTIITITTFANTTVEANRTHIAASCSVDAKYHEVKKDLMKQGLTKEWAKWIARLLTN